MVQAPQLNVHALWPRSVANGPGQRAVIWLQGCPGCFNPETHAGRSDSQEFGEQQNVDAIVEQLRALGDTIEGVTLSGGEPLQQPGGVMALLESLRSKTDLTVLMFSGYTIGEIRELPGVVATAFSR